MKHWLKWGFIALVILALVAGVWRALSARKAQQQTAASQATPSSQTLVELAPGDVVQVKQRELSQGLAISGTLKALNSAFVKARVAGELQGLTVREGDRVQVGEVIARVDATEYQARVRQAQEQADAARAQIEIAQRQYDNNRALVNQGFISKTALDTSSSNLLAAQAGHKAALAAVDVARKALDDTVLKAPISGLIAQRLTQPGERVGVDARIVEIVDLSQLELEASLSAAESVRVRAGQLASLQIEGVITPVKAKVVRIGPSAQAGSRSVLAYLAIASTPGLRQGLFAQGTLGTDRTSSLSLPLSAVRTDKPVPYVQIVDKEQIAHREVTLGARGDADGEFMVAVQGLPENTVVIGGQLGPLRAGTAVKFTSSPLSAPSSAASAAR